MRLSAKVLFMLLTLALALPGAAHAQSAGDEQYVDPFEGQGGGGGGNNNGNSNGGNDGSETGGSDDGTTSTTAQTDTTDTTTDGTESDDETLPATGLPLLPIALIGTFLLGAGVALRRGTKLPSATPSLASVPASPLPAAPLPARPARPVAPIARLPVEPAAAPRSGLPAVGFGLVGLFILSKALRRRA